MPHIVRWDLERLKQDPGSMRTFEKTDVEERNEVKRVIEQWVEMFSTRQEIMDSGTNPNEVTIKGGRKFHLQWSAGEELDGQPGYFVVKVYVFRRMN